MTSNEELFARARRLMPGGVSSPVRAFKAVGGTPYFVAEGKGARVKDVEGNAFIDYVQSYGASILGHAHPRVVEALREQAGKGTSFGAPTEPELRLAELICERVPGVEMVRFVSTGAEATAAAVRIARAATGRDKVMVFEGCYHGSSDQFLFLRSVRGAVVPSSKGVPAALARNLVLCPYNAEPVLERDVACVIVEPVAANMGLVAPADGWLATLRAACDNAGALLIFDEVITGFRLGPAGASGLFNVRPDLWCFGKVIGGGLPLAAVAGGRDLLGLLAPEGPVYQAGTLSGNPLAAAAGVAVLESLDPGSYAELERKVGRLAKGLEEAVGSRGLPVRVPRVATLLSVFFSESDVTDYAHARESVASGAYARFFRAMLRRGVALPPSGLEVMFTSLAHTDADIDATIEAADEAAYEMVTEAG
jgi:glutamate-1-semialdehyde 2,1-aminomutase